MYVCMYVCTIYIHYNICRAPYVYVHVQYNIATTFSVQLGKMSSNYIQYLFISRELSEKFSEDLGRHNYVTPTSYLELISSFKSLLANKRGSVLKLKKRYEVGLEKLEFAASQVSPSLLWLALSTVM